jgi:hypothetical protein
VLGEGVDDIEFGGEDDDMDEGEVEVAGMNAE